MIDLDLMQYKDLLRVKKENGKTLLFDVLRKKWLVLQPEELVRQLVVQYLILEKQYSPSRIKPEKGLKVNTLSRRCDLLIYNERVEPFLLVECKAPHVPLTHDTFMQIAGYNLPLRVPYLLLTNGIHAFCCALDYENSGVEFLDEIPSFMP